jgi:hypothetical protein
MFGCPLKLGEANRNTQGDPQAGIDQLLALEKKTRQVRIEPKPAAQLSN